MRGLAALFMNLDLLGGQSKTEDGPMGVVVANFDDAAMRLHDGAAERQPKADASTRIHGPRIA